MAQRRKAVRYTPPEKTPATEAVDRLATYLRAARYRNPNRGRSVPGLWEFRGSTHERQYGALFVGAILVMSEVELSGTTPRVIFDNLDAYRAPYTVDPERRLTAESRAAIQELPCDLEHPALAMGALLLKGLGEARSPASGLAVEALLAIRIALAAEGTTAA